MRAHYQVNEIFMSVQGEGLHTGKKASFIRLQGCTVGCPWCDSGPLADMSEGRHTNGQTRNTWGAGGERMTVEDIVFDVLGHWDGSVDPHVIITGGEPTLYNLDGLINGLRKGLGRWPYIQLETSGQNMLKGGLRPDWITWSPKKNLDYLAPPELLALVNEVKFVVDRELTQLTVADMEAYLNQEIKINPPILLMPEGCPPTQTQLEVCYRWALAHPTWRVADRLQYRIGVR